MSFRVFLSSRSEVRAFFEELGKKLLNTREKISEENQFESRECVMY